ncbi:hypothetical protein [Myxococcus sp. Y35]|uniref:hypothetical protein n=1 Tax=Pseudomyxococcus flavus TaxID=3115648 RepID=UPI003CEDB0BB
MTKHILVLLLLAAPAAHAYPSGMELLKERPWLFVGPMLSVAGRSGSPQLGLGVEATFNVGGPLAATGVFSQVQWMTGGHTRFCGGIQMTGLGSGDILILGPGRGLELGVKHETGTDTRLATTGLHIASFIGFLGSSIGLRLGIPLGTWGSSAPGGPKRTAHGTEVGLVLALKAPIPLKSCRTLACNLLH